MRFFGEIITRERSHFHRLSLEGQRFFKTLTLYELLNPLFNIFLTAFLWRQTQDTVLVTLYYICQFIGIPLGFYLNGLFLRKYSVPLLSFLSLFLWGGLIATLIFLPELSLQTLCIFGFSIGIAIGMFWANRNLLTLKTTTSETRIYFSGLEAIMSTITKITIPVLIGWFIVLGSRNNLYSELTAYQIIAVVMLCIIGAYGLIMLKFQPQLTSYRQLFLQSASPSWQLFRQLQIVLGFLQGGLMLLPALMVLTLLGQEETLGTVQSVAAILSTIAVYKIAKTLGVKYRLLLLQISIALVLVGAISFSIFYSGIGVLLFYATHSLSQPLWWMATSSLNYDLIDNDKNPNTHYAYISDQEIYLNGGRIVSLLVFLSLILFVSDDFALRFMPLIFAAAQIFMSFLTKAIEKQAKTV